MIPRALVVIAVLSVAACATPSQTVIGSAPVVETKTPVIEPCITAADIPPAFESAMGPRSDNVEALALTGSADAKRLKELVRRQRALLEQCAKASISTPAKGDQ